MKPEIRAGLEQIVGVRKYVRKAPRGSSEVIVEVGLPQHLPAEEELSDWWACPLRIRGLGRPRELYAGGSDSWQALELAMRLAAQTLSSTPAFKKRQLFWEGSRTPIADEIDFQLPLSLPYLQMTLDLTRHMLTRARRRPLTRAAEQSVLAMLRKTAKSMAECARCARNQVARAGGEEGLGRATRTSRTRRSSR